MYRRAWVGMSIDRCIAEAHAERHLPSPMLRLCKHPGNVEYALFFEKVRQKAVERGNNETWINALQKVVSSVAKYPIRVRHLTHAKGIKGVGPKMQALFTKYLDAHPPAPPTADELALERAAKDAEAEAREVTREKLRAERERKKRTKEAMRTNDASDIFGTVGTMPNQGDPPTWDGTGWSGGLVGAPSAELTDRTADDPPAAKRPKKAKGEPKKAKGEPKPPWEPGYRTAAFAIGCTLHRLHIEGRKIVGIKELQDESEASGLSNQGIKPRGDAAGAQNMADPTARYRGGRGGGRRFEYHGWSCFESSFVKAPRGHDVPLAMRWSNPAKIKLTDEGLEWCATWHGAAHQRGDCTCATFSRDAVDAAIANGPKARWERETLEPWRRERERTVTDETAEGRDRPAAGGTAATGGCIAKGQVRWGDGGYANTFEATRARGAEASPPTTKRDARMAATEAVASRARAAVDASNAAMCESASPFRVDSREEVRPTADEVRSMSVRELRRMLELARVAITGCSEKPDLVELALRLCAGSTAPFGRRGINGGSHDVICIDDDSDEDEDGSGGGADPAPRPARDGDFVDSSPKPRGKSRGGAARERASCRGRGDTFGRGGHVRARGHVRAHGRRRATRWRAPPPADPPRSTLSRRVRRGSRRRSARKPARRTDRANGNKPRGGHEPVHAARYTRGRRADGSRRRPVGGEEKRRRPRRAR